MYNMGLFTGQVIPQPCAILTPELFTLEQWQSLAISSGFDVSKLAAMPEVALSVRTVERLFERRFSKPPTHFLKRWWVEHARDYIRLTGAGNKEVAHRFGFWDEAHLCHMFKQVLNRSPQSFSPRHLWKEDKALSHKYKKLSPLYKVRGLEQKRRPLIRDTDTQGPFPKANKR